MPEVTQEQWEKMSPEEKKELQKKNCIFCKMIAGEIPTFKVYEDDKCVAILDINPGEEGHVLLLPKEHYQILPVVPNEILGHLAIISKKISAALLKLFKLKGTSIFFEIGQAAGQKSPHVLMHIIPAKENNLILKPKNKVQDYDKTIELLNKLRQKLGFQTKDVKEKQQEKKKKESEKTTEKENTKQQPKKQEKKKKENEKTTEKKEQKQQPKKQQKKKDEVDLDKISAMFK
jgi:histidine triad (HIT) family protein